jgi:non-lysosomal glucosylceramidase
MADKQIPYDKNKLFAKGEQRKFTGDALKEIAFPLGGIGSGTISLGGRGQLRDWELFNRPQKGNTLPYTFPAIYVKPESGEAVARVLESRLQPHFIEAGGMAPNRVCGLPRLREAVFQGEYPFAHVDFRDPKLPVKVELTAFNPMIPLNEKDSAIPTAVLRYKVTNNGSKKADGTICWSLQNAVGGEGKVNEFIDAGGFRGVKMTSTKYKPGDLEFGSMALVTTASDVTCRKAWPQAGWWDAAQEVWDDFKGGGDFTDAEPENRSDITSLGVKFSLKPGESVEIPFIITWYFPNRENTWNGEPEVKGARLRNRYANWWDDAWDVAGYVTKNLGRLEKETRLFADALYSSTLPAVALDAAGSNMSIMRTQTGLFLDDDRFYAFEGCGDQGGCCPMNCTHVWNYEQAVAHLYPRLERTMRLTDFTANVEEDGKMAFRTTIPLGHHLWKFHAAADGQMGCILKLYREYMLSGDMEFLKLIYPAAKQTMSFVWLTWDKDEDGMMEAIQHNTYDIEFIGANTMMGTLYLGALKAMEKISTILGEDQYAAKCKGIYDSGSAKHVEKLFNGEFFKQDCDPETAPRYQFGPGCLSDQLLGQWFCDVVDLGYVLPEANVKSALRSVFKYNWKGDLSDHESVQRTYALNDEAGLLLCTWPKGGRPRYPFTYADEVWTGIEYQVAGHLIYEDMVEEGLAIVKGVRDRHDGVARNPWNEFECGHHYARAMSSWSLILALSGFHFNAREHFIAFAPKVNAHDFKCFYSTGSGWGVYSQKASSDSLTAKIGVTWGEVDIQEIRLLAPEGSNLTKATPSGAGKGFGASVRMDGKYVVVKLSEPVKVGVGEGLEIEVG